MPTYVDRSRIELGWICPRARFWAYHWEGIGLVPITENKDLAFGRKIAEQTAVIKQGLPWNASAFAPGDETLLACGLLTGYETLVWPRWQRDFEVIAIEKECPKRLTKWGLIYNSRPDTIVRRKSDKSLWYGPEDKTTGWLDSILGYANSVQLHATAMCMEEHFEGERVAGALVQGLYKGFVKEDRLHHPLAYAYVKEGRAGIIPDQWSVKWVRGWERAPVSQYPGGVREWLKKLTPEELAGIFPTSEPVTLKRAFAEEFFEQVRVRETEIANAGTFTNEDADQILRRIWPQHFSQCDNFGGFKKVCERKDLCFNPTTKKFPLTLYKRRTPHHDNEQKELVG